MLTNFGLSTWFVCSFGSAVSSYNSLAPLPMLDPPRRISLYRSSRAISASRIRPNAKSGHDCFFPRRLPYTNGRWLGTWLPAGGSTPATSHSAGIKSYEFTTSLRTVCGGNRLGHVQINGVRTTSSYIFTGSNAVAVPQSPCRPSRYPPLPVKTMSVLSPTRRCCSFASSVGSWSSSVVNAAAYLRRLAGTSRSISLCVALAASASQPMVSNPVLAYRSRFFCGAATAFGLGQAIARKNGFAGACASRNSPACGADLPRLRLSPAAAKALWPGPIGEKERLL